MLGVFEVERLDPELAYQLGSGITGAMLDIERLKRGKDDSTKRLLRLIETLENLTNKPALERLDFERFNIAKFFGEMFNIEVRVGKTTKTYEDEVFHAVREETENFRLVMDKKPEADFKRALDFCFALHWHVLPCYGPNRYGLAA